MSARKHLSIYAGVPVPLETMYAQAITGNNDP